MENSLYLVTDEYPHLASCAQCGSSLVLHGHPTLLCRECREEFLKYPIPIWIKCFGVAVLAVVVYCCISFPSNLSLGLSIERGKRAEEEKRYVTAQREFTKAEKFMPDDIDIQCHLALAAFHNMDLNGFSLIAEKLEGRSITNEKLYKQVDRVMTRFAGYLPKDSMIELMKVYNNAIPDQPFRKYLRTHPDDIYGHFSYASILFDHNRFKICDSLLQYVLRKDPDYFPALRLMASLKRETNEFEDSDRYCDAMLSINREAGYALASKARTRLKQKKDEEGLNMALQSVQLDNADPYNIATLILAYHFNGQFQKRDELITACKQNNDSTADFVQYASDVINGKVPFRIQ